MAIYIETTTLERTPLPNGQGEMTEIMNRDLCGAESGVALLRWLGPGQRFVAEAQKASMQLIYLIEGEATIELSGVEYAVDSGCGVYLGTNEGAEIIHRGNNGVRLLHLIVPPGEGDN